MDKLEKQILNRIDKMIGYEEKLKYLNKLFLRTTSSYQENVILDMIEQLKSWGK